MTTGASASAFWDGFALYPLGVKNDSTYESSLICAFVAMSLTTNIRQHCVLAHDGAWRMASSTACRFFSSTGVSKYFLTLLLVLIVSKLSLIHTSFFMSGNS